jgi:hypothetical protein
LITLQGIPSEAQMGPLVCYNQLVVFDKTDSICTWYKLMQLCQSPTLRSPYLLTCKLCSVSLLKFLIHHLNCHLSDMEITLFHYWMELSRSVCDPIDTTQHKRQRSKSKFQRCYRKDGYSLAQVLTPILPYLCIRKREIGDFVSITGD